MSTQPPRSPARLWRWLTMLALAALFLGAYWLALQRIGAHIGDGVEQALRPVPGLEQTTAPVD